MKKVFIIVFALFLSMPLLMAQPPEGERPHRPERMERPMDHAKNMEKILTHLDENVALTEEQEIRIRAILEETTTKIKALEKEGAPLRDAIKSKINEIKDSNMDRKEMKEKVRQIMEEHRSEMEEYKGKIQEIRSESKARINDELTTEQKAKLYEIMSERGEKRGGAKKFRKNKSEKNKLKK